MDYPAKWNRNGPLDERCPSRSQQSSLRVLYILLGSGRNLVVGLDHSGLRDRRFGRGVLQEKSVFAFSWFGCHCLGLEAYDVWYVPVKVGIETGRCSCTFAISSVLFSGKL